MKMARLTRTSYLSGKPHTMEFDQYDQEEFDRRLTMWKRGYLIQEAFPELSLNAREFIMTGITEEEWNKEFSDEY